MKKKIRLILVLILVIFLISALSTSCAKRETVEVAVNFPEETEGIVWFADNLIQPSGDTVNVKIVECGGTIILQKDDVVLTSYIIKNADENKAVEIEVDGNAVYKIGLVNSGVQNCTLQIDNATLLDNQKAKRNIITRNTKVSEYQTMKELFPVANFFIPYTGDIWASKDDKSTVTAVSMAENGCGYVITVETTSFGGKLTEMIGIGSDGAITGVKVISHGDTPGVGTKALTDSHLSQYTGVKELSKTSAKREANIDSVSGATVTSNAVHYGVYVALKQYELLKAE